LGAEGPQRIKVEGGENKYCFNFDNWKTGDGIPGAERIWKEYGTVMKAIQFAGVASMSDLLTRDAVFVGVEYMWITWLYKLLGKIERLKAIGWLQELREIEKEIYSPIVDPMNLERPGVIIKDVGRANYDSD
jgi:hypothetical protein